MQQQSTTKGFAILSIAGIAAKLISLLYIPILTRIITPAGMSNYYKIYDVFVFIYAITNVGMQTAISKYIAELSAVGNYKDAIRAFKISRTILLIVGSIGTIFLIIFVKPIAALTNNPNIEYGLICIAPAILITAILSTYKAYFQGRNQMKPVAVASVLEQFANVVISLAFAGILMKLFGSATLGSAGGTVGTSIGALIAVFYLIYVYKLFKVDKEAKLKQNSNIKRVRTKKIIKVLMTYGIPITLTAGLQNLGNIIDLATTTNRLIVAGFTKVEAEGIYTLLGQWRTLINIPMVFITALCVALLPILSKAKVLNDRAVLKKNINFAFRVTYILSIPCTVGLALLSKEIYKCMFTRTDGYFMMVIGSITVVFMSIVFVQNIILQSLNQFYFVIYTLILGLFIKIVSNYILIANENINIYGAVIGFILYFGIVMLVNEVKVRRVTKFKINHFKLLIKPTLAAIFMGISILIVKLFTIKIINIVTASTLISFVYTAFIIIIAIIVYGTSLILMRAVKAEDLKTLSPKLYNKIPKKIKNYL